MEANAQRAADDVVLPPLPVDDDDISLGLDPLFFPDDQVNPNVFAAANQAVTPAIRQSPSVTWVEAYDPVRWAVTDRDAEVWPVLVDGVQLGSTQANQQPYQVANGKITFNGKAYGVTDYKGRPILAPNYRMWGWYTQRKVTRLVLADNDNALGYSDRVVFGTSADNYTDYPEKWGFKSRRGVRNENSWVAKNAAYEQRLTTLNPTRAGNTWKDKKVRKWNGDFAPPGRWDEIHEESGLRIKHAPCILMKNQFISTYENFVGSYLDGAQGQTRLNVTYSTSAFVTNHEIYRMFAGKYRRRILDNTLFADGNLVVSKPQKIRNTANPFKAILPGIHYKSPVNRWYRVNFKSL
jgi:hypothetical protein